MGRFGVVNTGLMALALAVCLAAVPAPVRADEPQLYSDISAQDLKTLLERKGYTARIDANRWGDPVVHAANGPLKFRIWGQDCSGQPRRCERLDFSAGFKAGPQVNELRLDEFNETYVFGKAYLTDDGTAYVDFPVNLAKGVSEGNLEDNLGLWLDTLRTFADFIGWFEGS